MMTTDTIDLGDLRPIDRTEARALGLAAYEQLFLLLEDLDDSEWRRPTVCAEWTVDDMVGHLLGAAKSMASMREMIRQQAYGKRHARDHGGNALDATNDLQVRDHVDLAPAGKVAALRSIAERAVTKRTGLPGLVRRIPVPLDVDAGSFPDDAPSSVSLGHVNEILYLRDSWLHRVDIARATGRDARVDRDADVRILEDVVIEWARAHGQPFTLRFEDAIGRTYRHGTGGEAITTTAEDFAFAVTRRAPADGLLSTFVLF